MTVQQTVHVVLKVARAATAPKPNTLPNIKEISLQDSDNSLSCTVQLCNCLQFWPKH